MYTNSFILLPQILTSVKTEPILVPTMLNVTIPSDPTTALARMDILVMETIVQVGCQLGRFFRIHYSLPFRYVEILQKLRALDKTYTPQLNIRSYLSYTLSKALVPFTID